MCVCGERGRCGFRVTSSAGRHAPGRGLCPSKPGHLVYRMGPSPAPQFRPPTPSRSAVSGGWGAPEGNRAWRPQSTTWGETESGHGACLNPMLTRKDGPFPLLPAEPPTSIFWVWWAGSSEKGCAGCLLPGLEPGGGPCPPPGEGEGQCLLFWSS